MQAARALSLHHLWPALPLGSILFEDDDLVLIDKPAQVSTHASESGQRDDAFSRVKEALAERCGGRPEDVYLGIHQRLDRDTSGVLLFTKRKSANGPMAREFEGRAARKVYVAAVSGWPVGAREGTMRHQLVPADDGKMRVGSGRGSKEAVTAYRVLRRGASGRALLELRPETGRTHQIRVQIAALGGRVAGDVLYGDVAAPRLLLHASSLTVKHPTSERPLTVSAPVPEEFEHWVEDRPQGAFDGTRFARLVERAVGRRYALGRNAETTAFRLFHEAGDGMPGLAVDLYGSHLLVHLSSPEAESNLPGILDVLATLGGAGIYVMSHPKQSNTLVDPRRDDRASPHAVRGSDVNAPLVVLEEGLRYLVRLGDGLKTGIFLDQRENRGKIRELSGGARVLNLFAYTCGFSVAAAAGGAAETTSVDASLPPLDWGRENLRLNGFDSPQHALVQADTFEWLRSAEKRGQRYDLVICDPPSFATTKTSRFSAKDDLAKLAALCLSVVAPGGALLFCTNHRGTTHQRFRRQMHQASRDEALLRARPDLRVQQIKDLAPPSDFPAAFGNESHLKAALVRVG